MEDQTKALQKYYTGHGIRRSSSPRRKILKFFDKFYYIPWILLVAIILVYPIIYCGGKFWYLPLVSFSVALIWIFSLLSLAAHRRSLGSMYWHPGLLLFLLPMIWGAIQLLPMGGLLSWISPTAADWWQGAAELGLASGSSLSLAPQSTMHQLHLLIVCGAVFYILMNLARSRYNIRMLMLILACSTFVSTLVSLFGYFIGDASDLAGGVKAFSGAFLNRNHFACFLGMGIFANIGLILSLVCERGPDNPYDFSWKKFIYPLFFALFIQLMALLLTLSRGGTLTVGIGVIFIAFCWICFGRAQKDSRQKIMAFGCILASALVAAMPFVLEALSERFSKVSGADTMVTDDRWLLWKNSLSVLKDFVWTGCGLGSFGDVIQAYEAGNITSGYIVYAHNDWLQWLVEMGAPVALVFLVLVLWTFSKTLKKIWGQPKTMYRWCGLAAFTALVVASLHELVDFNLQSYPNALLYSVLLAVFFICGRRERNYDQIARDGCRSSTAAFVFLGAAAMIAFLALPWQYRGIRAGIYHTELYELLNDEKNIWRDSASFGRKLELLSEKARFYAPNDAAVLRRSSDAYLMQASYHPEKEEEYWRKSWHCMLEACRRRPFRGEDIYMLSMLYAQGRKWLPDYSSSRQADLYEWVMKCQPTVLDTAYDMAVSYYYLYLDARRSGEVGRETLTHYRERCLQLFALSFHEQDRGGRRQVFDMIWYLMPDVSRLLQLLPPSYELKEQLLVFLIGGNYRKDALLVLRQMEKELSPRMGTPDGIEKFYQLQVHRRRLSLMQKKSGFAPEEQEIFRKAARDRDLLHWKQLQEKEFSGPDDYAGQLWELVQSSVFTDEILVEGARAMQRLGNISDMVMLLVHLAYHPKAPEAALLEQANKMIQGRYSFSRPGIVVRYRFLQNALPIMLQEGRPSGISPEQIYRHVILLGELLAEMEKRPEMSWSQMHLIPFYMGRGYELLNVPSRALDAYRQALKFSANNLWVRQRIEAVHAAAGDRPGAADGKKQCGAPVFYIDRSMALLDREIVPEMIIDAQQKVDMTFRFLCSAPLPKEIQWQLSCKIGDQVFYRNLLDFGAARRSLAWKAGEEVTGRLCFAPMLEALRKVSSGHRNVPVTLELVPVLFGTEKPFAKNSEKIILSGFTLKFQ